ncbi:major facilitator superfamily domain-containing protein [Bisporella sp. PMI_857]|nr:major facilitator superfamily domain-containing protein [Bisporella sp. PMI_857]
MPKVLRAKSPRTIVTLLLTIVFILQFGGAIMIIPGLRVYEDIICHKYYESLEGAGHINQDGQIDESLCKVDKVQEELNFLLAVWNTLGSLAGLFATIPFGILADRIGRRVVFQLAVCSLVFSACYNLTIMYFWRTFPLRLMWFSPLHVILGGGQTVISMMFYAVGSDVTTDKNRGNIFLLANCVGLISVMIAPTVASFLMLRSPWIPLWIGLAMLALGMVPAFAIPDTLHPYDLAGEDDPETELDSKKSHFAITKTKVVEGVALIKESASILNAPSILFLLLSFFILPFTDQSLDLSLRYISKRYGWRLADTGFLLSMRAFVNVNLFAWGLPIVSYYLTERLQFSAKQKDLSIAKVSVIFYIVGFLLMAGPTIGSTITGLIVLTLGSGLAAMLRALITGLVDQQHVGRLYAAISIVETLSALLAWPTVAALYALGLKLKGAWMGLPFLAVALICFFGGIGIWCFDRFTKDNKPPNAEEETACHID